MLSDSKYQGQRVMCFKYYGTRVLRFQSSKDRGLCVLILRSETCAFKLARTAVMCSNKTERVRCFHSNKHGVLCVSHTTER